MGVSNRMSAGNVDFLERRLVSFTNTLMLPKIVLKHVIPVCSAKLSLHIVQCSESKRAHGNSFPVGNLLSGV